jgi:SagB-type dehydrogenase family enzyme
VQALDYHNHTKHSPESVRRNVHFLDWANYPLPFKIYPDLESIPLPRDTPQTGVSALSAVASPGVPERNAIPDLRALASLLYFSAGITKRRGDILYRAAACTGALYEIELYLACGSLPDLAAGLYHFNPGDFSLRRLREGDFRGAIAEAAGWEHTIEHAPAILIATGIYFRNAWKYQARTYRHFGWDNGTITANLLALAAALGLPDKLICGFVDAEINRLLGLDTKREVSLTLVAVGYTEARALVPVAVPPLELEMVPTSKQEIDYPAMRAVHEASSFTSAEDVILWRDAAESAPRPKPIAAAQSIPLEPLSDAELPSDTIEEVILRRGSSRRFTRDSIAFAELSTILDRSTRGIPADFPPLKEIYLIVNGVDGLRQGSYYYNVEAKRLEPLAFGDFRARAAYLALEQELAGDAAVAVFFLADLKHWLGYLGNRVYRAVQLEAGILGGKMYLASYALGLGATGLTFYDDEVVMFFSPHADGKSAIFLTAVGRPAKRAKL